MQRFVLIIGVTIVTLFALLVLRSLRHNRRQRQRERMLQQLLEQADRFEAALKDCRDRLGEAHAAMAALPGGADGGRAVALAAVNAGLRDLLAHRLWIRDRAPHAGDAELERALSTIRRAQEQLADQVAALGAAQDALSAALRERGTTEPPP